MYFCFSTFAVARRARRDSSRCLSALIVLFVSTAALVVVLPAQAAERESGIPDYKISAEDHIEISVWKEPELLREAIVRPDGGISFPLVGDVQAAGKTPQELEEAIRARLERFVPDAVVTVSILEVRGMRIYVTGKVRSPGQFVVGRYVDVVQAVTLAGGFTPFAKTSDVQIIRREGTSEQVFKFNYDQIERGRNMSQNIMLQADDVVLVP